MPPPEQCFLSYAHHDHEAFERLRTHLSAAATLYRFRLWADTRIQAGDYWHPRIQAEIERSQIFVLLTTADFFASGYILQHELPAILDRHLKAKALVVPVIAAPCGWRGFFGHYIQVVPMAPGGRLRPVAEWRPKEHGFHAAAEAISAAIGDWFGIAPTSPFAPPGVATP